MMEELVLRGYPEDVARQMIAAWAALNIADFNVQGYFYNQGDLRFRRFLEIRRINADIIENENDLNVIMMFPGASRPVDDENDPANLNGFVRAFPDDTIKQIMRIMNNCNFNYIKIINLSDIRAENPIAEIFYDMLNNQLQNIDHSIFSEANREQIRNYLNPNAPFLLAWGVDERLANLAQQALDVIHEFWGNNIRIFGWQHDRNPLGYYHPLPRQQFRQIEWVRIISDMINNN